MIAQCTTCGRQFTTDTWGEQSCPHCGTRVVLQAPDEPGEPGEAEAAPSGAGPVSRAPAGVPPLAGMEGPAPGAPPPPEGARGPGGPAGSGDAPASGGAGAPGPAAAVAVGAVPWERRGELGVVSAFFLTLKESVLRPSDFFSRVRTDTSDGAFLYGWIVYSLSLAIGGLWSGVQMRMQMAMLGSDPELQEAMGIWRQLADRPELLLLAPVIAAVYLLVWAALVHLGLVVLSANHRGWNASMKSVAYSVGPTLLALLPVCGGTIGSVWAVVLTVIAVRHTQRTTPGKAVVAVLWPVALGVCCAVAAAALGGLALASALGGAGG